jgi:adenylosuccinate lyase
MGEVLDEADVLLRRLVADLADLAETHAVSVALGRTHAQPALPMGFGLKVTSWVDELQRDAERLGQMRSRCWLSNSSVGSAPWLALTGRGTASDRIGDLGRSGGRRVPP